MATANANLSNKLTVQQLEQEFQLLGKAEGFGRDSQIKFHLRLVEAAHQGTLDLKEDKHGPEKTDAYVLTEAYYNARNGNDGAQWDAKSANVRKARSVAKLCIKLGCWNKSGGPNEPWQTVQELMTKWRELRKKQADNLDDACNTLFRFARAQLAEASVIGADRLQEFCFKRTRDGREAEAYVESIRKTAVALKEGTLKGGAQSNTKEIGDIINACKNWLVENAKKKGATRQAAAAGQAAKAPATATVTPLAPTNITTLVQLLEDATKA